VPPLKHWKFLTEILYNFLTAPFPKSSITQYQTVPGHINIKNPSDKELKGFCLSSKEEINFILAPIATEILF
jgi:hypothetical protein